MDSRVILALAFNGAMVATCGFALLRGGMPERLGAFVNLAAFALTVATRLILVGAWAPMHLVVLTIDAAVAVGFYLLAIHTTRFWPIWAFGFALANIIISIAGALLPMTPLFAYHTGLGIYAYLALAALAIGTYRLPRDATPDQRRGCRLQREAPTKS